MTAVYVIGVGMTPFIKPTKPTKPNEPAGPDYHDLAREAGNKALEDAGVNYLDIEEAIAGYCYGDSTSG